MARATDLFDHLSFKMEFCETWIFVVAKGCCGSILKMLFNWCGKSCGKKLSFHNPVPIGRLFRKTNNILSISGLNCKLKVEKCRANCSSWCWLKILKLKVELSRAGCKGRNKILVGTFPRKCNFPYYCIKSIQQYQ